jgi:hypothetical protein
MRTELRHNLNFSQGPDRINLVDECILNLLDSDTISVRLVDRFPNSTVVAFAHFLDHFIFGLDAVVNLIPVASLLCFLFSFTFLLFLFFFVKILVLSSCQALVDINQSVDLGFLFFFLALFGSCCLLLFFCLLDLPILFR